MGRSRTLLGRGFTLVELLIVIIIIAVLAAIAIPKFANSSLRSKEASLHADLKLLRNAVELFRNDTGVYPNTLSDLVADGSTALPYPTNGKKTDASVGPINAGDCKGPYLSSVDVDPVSGIAFGYSTTAGSVGKVTSSATGNGLDGTAYSTW